MNRPTRDPRELHSWFEIVGKCMFPVVLLSFLLQGSPFAAVPGLSTQSTAGERINLAQVVATIAREHPLLQATAAGSDSAAAGLRRARAARLPSLSFGETFVNSNNPVFVFGKLLEQGRFSEANFAPTFLNHPGSLSNFRSSVNLRVPLFNRFQIDAGIDQAEIGVEMADLEADWVRQQLTLEAVRSFYGVIVADTRVEVARKAVDTAREEVENIRNRVDQGIAVESDLLAMQVQLAEFQQQLVEAEGEREVARADLNTLLSRRVDASFQIEGDLEVRNFQVGSLDSAIQRALEQRPDFLQVSAKIEQVRQELRKSRGSYWPDLNLFADYGLSGQDPASGSADFAVGATLNFTVVDFGRSAEVDQAAADLRRAEAQKAQAANRLRLEVVQAYQEFRSAEQRLELAETAVARAEETLRIVEDRHDVGLTLVTEVLRAQTALLRSRLNFVGARYGHYLGYARVLLATGSLADVDPFE